MTSEKFQIVGLNYMTIYLLDLAKAVAFYESILGPPVDIAEGGRRFGWKMGDTWLTMFPAHAGTDPDSNPANAEFAIQVATPQQVDGLYAAFIEAGAKECMAPDDGEMYEAMRFACVDDPFGMRIDIYCPI